MVGGDAIEQAHIGEFADFRYFGSIDKEFHGVAFLVIRGGT